MPGRVTGVILAGGKGARMGGEKPLMQVGGVSLIERVAGAVSPCVAELVLVTNRPDLYAFLGLPMLPDAYVGRGPLAGIHAALEPLAEGAALVVASDYPFLTRAALGRLAAEDPAGGVVVPQIEGQLHPLCALYDASVKAAIREAIENGELMVLSALRRLDRQRTLEEEAFGGPEAARRIFFNVNTPEDLRQAERLRGQADAR